MSPKDLFLKFIDKLNSREYETWYDIFHQNAIYHTFELGTGIYVDVKGRDTIINLLKTNFSDKTDTVIVLDKFVSEGSRLCVYSTFEGTTHSSPTLPDAIINYPFKLRAIFYLEFLNDKIHKMELFADTFETLKTAGLLAYEQGDSAAIERYLDLLANIGLYRKSTS
ncbi:MAG: nuclear transport factor 2 family protein [Candidatus Kariarchaeaceae archaeon]|jgi:hypothetical protein